MFNRNEKKDPQSMANDIAKEVGRRGFPAAAKPIPVMSEMGKSQKFAVIIPNRGLAVINNNLNVVVASPKKPLQPPTVFEYENAAAAAENILRNLPLS